MPEAVKNRKDWIDALRALAIILVIYGHRVPEWSEYFVFSSPIKIPLFFAITGYVFSGGNGNARLFFTKLLRTIVIPWLILTIVPYLAATPIKGVGFLFDHLKAVLIGEEYWYMPCCIIAEIVWFFILKVFRKTWQIAGASVILFAGGMALYRYQLLSFFMINRAFTVQIFLLIGWLMKRYENQIMEKAGKGWILITGTAVYIVLGVLSVFLYPGQTLDVHLNAYYNHAICQLMIWIGIGILFIFGAKYIKKYPRWWVLIGQNTLVIYLLHNYAVKAGVKVFNLIHLPVNRLTNVFLTVAVTAVCLGISLLINRFIPQMMGKRRKTQRDNTF